MEETWEDIIEERSPRDLLKLIIKKGAVRADDAAVSLRVSRSVIDAWGKLLVDKRYALSDGVGAETVLSPTQEILMKLKSQIPQGAGSSLKDDSILVLELAKEKKRVQELESQLREKDRMLESNQKELFEVLREKAKLEEVLKEGEARKPSDLGANMLEVLLKRERAERVKLEELLRKKQAELDALRSGGKPAEPALASPVGEGAPAAVKTDSAPPVPAAASVAQEPKAAEPGRPEPSHSPVFDVDKAVSHGSLDGRKTDTDDCESLLNLLKTKGTVNQKTAAKELGVSDEKLGEWIAELTGYEAISVAKKMFGGFDLSLKKDADLNVVKERIESKRVRDEIRRMRGGT